MSEDLLGALVVKIVQFPKEVLRVLLDLSEKLYNRDREEWLTALKRFLRKENPWPLKKLALTNLKLVGENIRVVSQPFTRDSFFRWIGPAKLYFWDNFKNWILRGLPEVIPAFEVSLIKTQLTKTMTDSEILMELGHPKPFSPSEFAAIIRHLIRTQPNGEKGALPTNGYVSIFHIELEGGRVVVVRVHWYSGNRDWRFGVHGLDDCRWDVGSSVFSRSPSI